ncbi:MAG: phospholipase D-like domain-containing protein [Candidatus Tectomicrobia bacterium]
MHYRLSQCSVIGLVAAIFVLGTLTNAAAQTHWYEVYFTQVDNNQERARANPNSLDRILTQKLALAQTRIDAALHEIDTARITQALIQAHRRGVTVRIVTEYDYVEEASVEDLLAAGIRVVTDADRSGLMHNKFLVVDGRYVWTGSFNTTDNGAYKNNNNAIWIDSPELAANFTTEFTEMFIAEQFGVRSPTSLPHPVVTMPDGTKIYTYFAPEGEVVPAIGAHLRQAQSSIAFMAFSFTHDELGQIMRDRFQAGVDVRGVFERRGSSTVYSEYPAMRDLGMPVSQDTNKWSLHHKVIVIDRHTVITGSFNFSRNAQKTNDENVLIVVGNRDIAALYIEEFQRLVGTTLPRGVGALPAHNPPVSLPPLPPVPLPINTATQGQLESLPGIGPTLAQRIIAGRPYRNMQDLQRVKGIGVRKLAAIQDKIAFE